MPGELSFRLDTQNAADYARAAGLLAPEANATVRELTGGVSNVVLLVEPTTNHLPSFVLKQARPQLRVTESWHCPVERIWTEIDVLQTLGELLADAPQSASLHLQVPRLLFVDRPNFCFAMSAIDPRVPTWKDVMLAGRPAGEPAIAAGTLLALIHARTWQQPQILERFAATEFFEPLRVDPYYRHVQRNVPDLYQPLQTLIDSLAGHRRCLVHGDFSPKNLLLDVNELTLLDFEVGHYGDPAFDVGFFLTHLVLKWLWSGKDTRYGEVLAAAANAYRHTLTPQIGSAEWNSLRERSLRNLGGCLLARVEGKSRVDYLTTAQQQNARRLGRALLVEDDLPAELAPLFDF